MASNRLPRIQLRLKDAFFNQREWLGLQTFQIHIVVPQIWFAIREKLPRNILHIEKIR